MTVGETLREYNWGVTTNYLSIYIIVHVVTTRLACDAQPSISSYIKYMCLQYCATMCSDACVDHALSMYTVCALEPYNIVHSTKHRNDPR